MKNGTVYYDYRDNIVIDRDNPILAFKANRDRYDDKKQSAYAGMPMIGSIYSEDALTWNVFRILQSENSLHLLNHLFEEDLTDAKLLLWTYACSGLMLFLMTRSQKNCSTKSENVSVK